MRSVLMKNMNEVKDVMKGYGKKSPFASFLPGIAGIKGTPIWCYYVNRGQAVVSFGVQDKDHSIMEFYPAHTAYQNVSRTGFRTFIKTAGMVYEPFVKNTSNADMEIHMNTLTIEDKDDEHGFDVKVKYATLPGEEIGALMRMVTITNTGAESRELEVLDGMPALIPYGCMMDVMKNMVQTTKAYMQVEDADKKRPFFRVRFSMEDSAVVKKVPGGNFGFAVDEDGNELNTIVDPGLVFGYDLSLSEAVGFAGTSYDELVTKEQNVSNEFPTCFFARKKTLGSGESMTLYELIGQVRNKDIFDDFLKRDIAPKYFEEKFEEAERLTDELTNDVATSTANKAFDDYTRYNYMDNVLRGGKPISLPGGHTFYVYSRKHGDLERDYNYFSMSPEFYSQGNGNFRDVNQNRRCDTFFSRIVGDENIRRFYSLIQMDGYNPLKIEQLRFNVNPNVLGEVELKQPFTPGELVSAIKDSMKGINDKECEELFTKVMEKASETINGDFGEGYWSDHWTYNLDLIEDFLEVYPDKEKELLVDTRVKAFEAKVEILPRHKKYEETENGLRQYYYLAKRDNAVKEGSFETYADGRDIEMSLLSKLVLLSACKFAALDPEGMGVMMEGGKPGWYDALNGMPGMFGSSMNESYELLRMIRFTKNAIEKFGADVTLPADSVDFIENLKDIETKFSTDFELWDNRNAALEGYRDEVYGKLFEQEKTISSADAAEILGIMEKRLEKGVSKAFDLGKGIAPGYFTFEATEYDKKEDGIYPRSFKVQNVPYFLEGPVRFFKLENTYDEKKKIYDRIKASDLFDKKLSMYKVNASLENASFEYGRCKSFTPGWLENESIWLHMEYKYLLELLRSGLYSEFFEDFKNQAIPFLDKEVYGRSTLENSSFIASSMNPNKAIHGKGFVARLSGSTIEFISMWKLMFFGKNIFKCEDDKLVFAPAPAIPEYLIKDEAGKYTVESTLLADTHITYEIDAKSDVIPGHYEISEITVEYANGDVKTFAGSTVSGDDAASIRDGKAVSVCVKIAIR
jgi:hypothetical protein